MKIVNNKYEMVPIAKLRVHPENPRRGDLQTIGESIDANGFYGAIIAQKSTGNILAGSHRFHVAFTRGFAQVPVIWVDVDDDTARKIMLADNRIADLATYDQETLANILDQLAQDDALRGSGYNQDEVEKLLAVYAEPEERDGASFDLVITLSSEQGQRELFERLMKSSYIAEMLEPQEV